jgi:hypothetical protein
LDGGRSVTFDVNHFFGIETEFNGCGSFTKTLCFPQKLRASTNLFTYNVGPFKHRSQLFEPFVEALFGGAHSSTYQNLLKACALSCITITNPSNNAFDLSLVEDWMFPSRVGSLCDQHSSVLCTLARFGNRFTEGNPNQSNFRYNAGVVLRF